MHDLITKIRHALANALLWLADKLAPLTEPEQTPPTEGGTPWDHQPTYYDDETR
ncbi:hypothetical protein ABT332_13165 [Saccharomonospora azurea]|uniref:hypothetical protein n=1 Tax=Saccharomonospora azurea TaxID=40988 RepID=UPI003317EA57